MDQVTTAPELEDAGPSRWSVAILLGLQRKAPLYAGTVPASVVARRRARNKAARLSRRANRKP